MIDVGVHLYMCLWPKMNGTLVVDSSFQTLVVDFSTKVSLSRG